MANMIAPNGTVHSINAERGKSHCGRVVVGSEGVKKTRKETTCGRCDQLNPALKDTTAAEPTPAKAAATPASRRRGKVTATVETESATRGVKKTAASKRAASKVPGNAMAHDDDVQDLYAAFTFLLDANKVDGSLNLETMGTTLAFDHNGYSYMVWHPRYNAGGPDLNEWRIQWSEDFGSDDGVTEDFDTMEEALSWLIEDTGMKAAKVPPAPARKPARKPVAASKTDGPAPMKGAGAAHVRNALKSLGNVPADSMTKDQARMVASTIEALSTLV